MTISHVALPISKVLEYRHICEGILEENGLKAVEYAIWGQPELFSMLIVPIDDTDRQECRLSPVPGMGETVDRILSLAQDMGGSMEYCHGVGVKLAHLLPREMEGGYRAAAAHKEGAGPPFHHEPWEVVLTLPTLTPEGGILFVCKVSWIPASAGVTGIE